MTVSGEQGPRATGRSRGRQHLPQSLDEGRPVRFIPDDRQPLDPAADHVVRGGGRVAAHVTRHARDVSRLGREAKSFIHDRPLFVRPLFVQST
jgi:hypothetical protein